MRSSAAILALCLLAGSTLTALAQQPKPATAPDEPTFAAPFAPAAQAQATAAPTQAPTGDVPVPFGGLNYLVDPGCLVNSYVRSTRVAQDPATGAVVVYVQLLDFLKAGADGWVVIPQPENIATGAVAKATVGDRLCIGVEGVK